MTPADTEPGMDGSIVDQGSYSGDEILPHYLIPSREQIARYRQRQLLGER